MFLLQMVHLTRESMRKAYIWQVIIFNSLLFGCTVGPKYEAPEIESPCEWHSQPAKGMNDDEPDCFLWWESLNDPILNSLMERASQQNLDLYQAVSRVMEARIEKKGGQAARYPHIDASAAYAHARYNQKVLDDILGIRNCRNSDKHHVNVYEVGFDAEWEIDLFGMNAHEAKALDAQLQASEESLRDVWITLSAEIARNYIELRGLQQRLIVLEKNIEAQKDSIHLTDSLLQIGMGSSIDQWQGQEQLSTLESQKPQLGFEIEKSIHRLSILLGYAPGALFAELSPSGQLPCLPENMPIGVPSDLLRRRPDIRKAERELAAATERVGSAVAALFPRLTLSGFIGEITTHLCTSGYTWFVSPQLLLPVFNSKMLMQDVDINKLKAQQACYEYQKTVLKAFEETENAISSLRHDMERSHHLDMAEKSSQEAYTRFSQLYERGLKDYLVVQISNRSHLAAENAYLQSKIELLIDYVTLYKSLGGGWDVYVCEEE
jgi:outer membrane protein, multidrug efflux system